MSGRYHGDIIAGQGGQAVRRIRPGLLGLALVWSCNAPAPRVEVAPTQVPALAAPRAHGRALIDPADSWHQGVVARAVAVRGPHVFVADHHGMTVLRVDRDPDAQGPALQPVARVATPGDARDIALHGDHAIIADSAAGVAVIDITRVEQPVLVSQLALPGGAASVHASPAGLAVIGLDDPVVSFLSKNGDAVHAAIELPGLLGGAAWIADDLYVASYTHGLIRLHPAGPAAVSVSALSLAGEAEGSLSEVLTVAARGSLLFVFTAGARLRVLDCAGPAPRELASLAIAAQVRHAFVLGDRLIALSRGADEPVLYDVSSPAHPHPVARSDSLLPLAGALIDADRPAGASGPADMLAVVADVSPALHLVDLAPVPRIRFTLPGAHIARIERLEPAGQPGHMAALPDVTRLLVLGKKPALELAAIGRYLAGEDHHVPARVFAVDHGKPVLRAELSDPSLSVIEPCRGSLCLIRSDHSWQRMALDPVTGVAAATAPGATRLAMGVTVMASEPGRDLLWLGSEWGRVLAATTRSGLVTVASYHLRAKFAAVSGLAIAGDSLVVVDGRSAILHVLERVWPEPGPESEPEPAQAMFTLARRGEFLLQGRALDVALLGSLVFVAEWQLGIQVVDITEPRQPREVLWLTQDPAPLAIDVWPLAGGDALVATAHGDAGVALHRWDGQRHALVPRVHLDTPGIASDVLLTADSLWIADTSSLERLTLAEVLR